MEIEPQNCSTWIKYADLEHTLGEVDRVRSIYELAVDQGMLDMPEVLWKAYIDFETSEGERDKTRALYERLLERTKHVKVWMSYARFEATPIVVVDEDADEATIAAATAAAERDERECLESRQAKSTPSHERRAQRTQRRRPRRQRGASCSSSLEILRIHPSSRILPGCRRQGEAPKRGQAQALRRRPTDGRKLGQEEYYDYVFPDDAGAKQPSLKLLEAAYAWKKAKAAESPRAPTTPERAPRFVSTLCR